MKGDYNKDMLTLKGRWGTGCLISCLLSLIGCPAQLQRSSESPGSAKQTTSAPPEAASAAFLIEPGHSVGALRLGDPHEQVLKVFPKKANYVEEYTYNQPCALTEIHWLDIDLSQENGAVSNGVFIYLKDGRVFQIDAASPRFRTTNGITVDSTPEEVRRHYPRLKSYVLSNSGAKVNGGRDLIYWVDRESGIAFEFYHNSKSGKRQVSKVIAFRPTSDFQPEGCISPPQELHELDPFALEPPG